MKKILIIAKLFGNDACIGSVRPIKLAKYLSRQGYHVDVITAFRTPQDIALYAGDVDKINHIEMLGKEESASSAKLGTPQKKNQYSITWKKIMKRLRGPFFTKLKFLLLFQKNAVCDKKFFREFESSLQEGYLKNQQYDVCISSFGPISSLRCGILYKKIHPEVKWICDFRDGIAISQQFSIWQKISVYREKKALYLADCVTVVSKGLQNQLGRGYLSEKVHLITNGFDRAEKVANNHGTVNEFSFVYTGALYNGQRDLSPLFMCLSELVKEQKIALKDLKFIYAGWESDRLKEQADAFGMQSIIHDYGLISHDACTEVQQQSRFLVLATWNTKREKGILTGKLMEYMLSEKPIVTLVNGEEPHSEARKLIEQARIGVVYEEALKQKDHELLKDWLMVEYKRYKDGKNPTWNPNMKVVDMYDYENIAKSFAAIIE